MSKATNVKATLIEPFDSDRLFKTPGAYCFVHSDGHEVGIVHSCPCGCGMQSGAYFAPSTSKVLWERSGTREALTLRPSIGIRPQRPDQDKESDGYHWHGYLTDGVWKSV